MGLDDYRAKRDFRRTPEPPPARARGRGKGRRFVVHRHEARRLHYDLRLEWKGVLCSWAVPKGFSYDPNDKHLAVRTEDHPLAYADFEGVIPSGEYGAGAIRIWDRGAYEPAGSADLGEALEKGEVKIVLRGRRLRGEWHLVRTDREAKHWLSFKSRDRYAGPARDSVLGVDLDGALEAPLPRALEPMQPGIAGKPFADPDWLFEAKLEGRRVLATKRGEAISFAGLGEPLAEVEGELRRIRAETAVLDGVLVSVDSKGRPSADELTQRLAGGSDARVAFYVFDLLYFDEFDLRPLPLVDRKGALRALLPPLERVLFVDHVPGEGKRLAETVAAAGLSGIVAKAARSPYTSGRSREWIEIPLAPSRGARRLPLTKALSRRKAPGAKGKVRFTNLEKVFWPVEGLTKGDLIAYFESVADLLLPHLRDRPVHLRRFPDGVEGKSFYQHQAMEDFPAWIRTEPIASESRGEIVPHVVCDDRDTLLFLANLGSVDLHPWLSRCGRLESPDWAVLDLDPKGAPFADVVAVARLLGDLLREIGLRPLVKTSGASGLHVFVPLKEGYGYEQSRTFCEALARWVARERPDLATVERGLGRRGGRVYVDFLQNGRGQTVVPPYVPRPVRGATVSTPLAWGELEDDLSPASFTIQTVPARLAERGDLFRPALTDGQDLLPAIEALRRRLRPR